MACTHPLAMYHTRPRTRKTTIVTTIEKKGTSTNTMVRASARAGPSEKTGVIIQSEGRNEDTNENNEDQEDRIDHEHVSKEKTGTKGNNSKARLRDKSGININDSH